MCSNHLIVYNTHEFCMNVTMALLQKEAIRKLAKRAN